MNTVTTEVRLARHSDADAIASVHDEAWRATYRGLIPGAELEKMISRRGPSWWQSAIQKGNRIALLQFGDDIAGYVNYGRNRAKALDYDGEIYELYLRPQFIGMGFGKRLFQAARKDLILHGIESVVVWALFDNPSAIDFYTRLGGKAVARSTEKFGTAVLDKAAFGWTLKAN